MIISFKATHFQLLKKENPVFFQISLSDVRENPDYYIVLERFEKSDIYEIANGMDGYYFEMQGVGNIGYNVFRKVILKNDQIILYVDNLKISDIDHIHIDISELIISDDFINALRFILLDIFEISHLKNREY